MTLHTADWRSLHEVYDVRLEGPLPEMCQASDHLVVKRTLGEVEKIYSDMCSRLHFLGSMYPYEKINHWLTDVA